MGNVPIGMDGGMILIQRRPVSKFDPGDLVRVTSDLQVLQRQQFGHGGYIEPMREILSKVVTVVGVDSDGDVKIKVTRGGREQVWVLNPTVLTSVFYVRVTSDLALLQRAQVGHGGFNDRMRGMLGRVVEVTGVCNAGDLRVKYDDVEWAVNPAVVTSVGC